MKTIDHLLLGVYLLARHQNPPLQSHRRAFLLGCIAPDHNLLSYLRRMPHGEKFRGHNAENSFGFLMRGIAELNETGLRSTWDYFRLGTLQQCLFRTVEMKGVCHESSDHNRLVPASH